MRPAETAGRIETVLRDERRDAAARAKPCAGVQVEMQENWFAAATACRLWRRHITRWMNAPGPQPDRASLAILDRALLYEIRIT
jgi:hypothetical protein